jgi:hypothetical protein
MKRRALAIPSLLFLLGAAPCAAADSVDAQTTARVLSANPDAPASALFWRKQLHGKVAVAIPVMGSRTAPGFALQVPAFIELHNDAPAFVPHQYWRGRISVEATSRQAYPSDRFAFGFSALAEHESDHTSGSDPGFLNKNGFATRVDLTWLFGNNALTLSTIARLHLRTCTISPRLCGNGGGREGSAAFEGTTEVVFDGGWSPRSTGSARYFVSAMANVIPSHRLAARESRAVLEAGVWTRRPEQGVFQGYVTGLVGHELGYLRANTGSQFGLGVRWSP